MKANPKEAAAKQSNYLRQIIVQEMQKIILQTCVFTCRQNFLVRVDLTALKKVEQSKKERKKRKARNLKGGNELKLKEKKGK